MQHRISDQFGWLAASVLIGVIWAVWHLPLWALDTPHAQISMLLFAGHVMCYSVIIGAAYAISGGSILPAILIHLTVNLASNCAIFAGFTDPNTWFRASLPPYAALAIVAALLVTAHAG
jgi:membrane protease YdiL (CAAX protease family)